MVSDVHFMGNASWSLNADWFNNCVFFAVALKNYRSGIGVILTFKIRMICWMLEMACGLQGSFEQLSIVYWNKWVGFLHTFR